MEQRLSGGTNEQVKEASRCCVPFCCISFKVRAKEEEEEQENEEKEVKRGEEDILSPDDAL